VFLEETDREKNSFQFLNGVSVTVKRKNLHASNCFKLLDKSCILQYLNILISGGYHRGWSHGHFDGFAV
jgi:hypothetical protein